MRCVWMSLALVLGACSVEQQGGELRASPPPVFQDQSWNMVRKDSKPGARACAVGAGEIDVLQVAQEGRAPRHYVIVDRQLKPGAEYKLLVGGNVYRMSGEGYSVQESEAIVADLLRDEVVYSEWMEFFAARPGANWLRVPNKISLENFRAVYEECRKFVSHKGR